MPRCYCETNNCGGRDVDSRTFDRHSRADRAEQARTVRNESKKVLEGRDEEFVTYFSSMTLVDRVSGSSRSQGSRLWSRASDPDDVAVVSPGHSKTTTATQRHRVDCSLRRIMQIEQSFTALLAEASGKLATVGIPEARNSPFPLKTLISSTRDLQDQLDDVKSKLPAVVESKASVCEQVEDLYLKLKAARSSWVEQAKKLPTLDGEAANNGFDSGTHRFHLSDQILHTSWHCSDHHFRPILSGTDPVLQLSVFIMVTLQVVLGISRRGGKFLLGMLAYLLQISLTRNCKNLAPKDQKLMSDFPGDPDSAKSQFHLDGKSTVYAVCPNERCHKTYKPEFKDGSPIALYPQHCSHRNHPGGAVCRTRLTRPRILAGVEFESPIKTFVSFDFKDWLAGLLSRPGYEDRMDASWSHSSDSAGIGTMNDIFDGDFLRTFQGVDGNHFSMGNDEGRYVFGLCVDFFNPYTNKQAGKKVSTGMISFVCFNLPPSMRYKPENMFLAGVIPGPKEPPLNTLNHYLTPSVDSLIELWQPGVKFSRTYNFEFGRLVLCALIAVICDLPGARKASGYASFSHEHFCNVCHCTLSNGGYGNTDYHSWTWRTDGEWRAHAQAFQATTDAEKRDKLFQNHGIRWSELLRLPYFDISRCIVVDSMHNLFLGLIKTHFCGVLGIGSAKRPEDPVIAVNISSAPADFKSSEKGSLEKLKKWLQAPLPSAMYSNRDQALGKLKSFHARVLQFTCKELSCPAPDPSTYNHSPTKHSWATVLLDWVCFQFYLKYFTN
jgi:hypothetical protein